MDTRVVSQITASAWIYLHRKWGECNLRPEHTHTHTHKHVAACEIPVTKKDRNYPVDGGGGYRSEGGRGTGGTDKGRKREYKKKYEEGGRQERGGVSCFLCWVHFLSWSQNGETVRTTSLRRPPPPPPPTNTHTHTQTHTSEKPKPVASYKRDERENAGSWKNYIPSGVWDMRKCWFTEEQDILSSCCTLNKWVTCTVSVCTCVKLHEIQFNSWILVWGDLFQIIITWDLPRPLKSSCTKLNTLWNISSLNVTFSFLINLF